MVTFLDSGKHLHEPKGKFTKLLLVDGLPAIGEPEGESFVGGPDMKNRVSIVKSDYAGPYSFPVWWSENSEQLTRCNLHLLHRRWSPNNLMPT